MRRFAPQDVIRLNIPPGTRGAYERALPDAAVELVEDPHLLRVHELRRQWPWLRWVFAALWRSSAWARVRLLGPRPAWVRALETWADVVLCPFHRDEIAFHRAPVLLVVHDFRVFDLAGDHGDEPRIVAGNIARARAIVTSWPHPFQRLRELFPQRAGDTAMVPFIVDIPTPAAGAVVDERLLLFVSSTAPHKNHEILIRALGLLRRRGDALPRIVCPGPTNEERREALHRLADREGVRDAFEIAGYVPREQVHRMYHTAAGVIVPTRYEALSGALLEALQFGRPVATSRIPSAQAFVDWIGASVVYFDPDSVESTAEAIVAVLAQRGQSSAVANDVRQRLLEITPERTAQRYHDMLAWVAGTAPRPDWLPYGGLRPPRTAPPRRDD